MHALTRRRILFAASLAAALVIGMFALSGGSRNDSRQRASPLKLDVATALAQVSDPSIILSKPTCTSQIDGQDMILAVCVADLDNNNDLEIVVVRKHRDTAAQIEISEDNGAVRASVVFPFPPGPPP